MASEFEYKGYQISIGEARARRTNRVTLPSGQSIAKPLCYNCAQPVTAFELGSCGSPKCNAVLRPLHRWASQLADRIVAFV